MLLACVGAFEIVCGSLILIGLLSRVAAIPLLIVICTGPATNPDAAQAPKTFFSTSDSEQLALWPKAG